MNQDREILSYWVMSIVCLAVGLLGLMLAVRATDDAIQAFGLALAGFGVLFCYFAIDRTHSLGRR